MKLTEAEGSARRLQRDLDQMLSDKVSKESLYTAAEVKRQVTARARSDSQRHQSAPFSRCAPLTPNLTSRVPEFICSSSSFVVKRATAAPGCNEEKCFQPANCDRRV